MPPSPWIGSTRNAAVCGPIARASASASPNGICLKPPGNGPNPSRYCGSRREADDRDRTAVEVALADDHFGAIGGNALDLVTPFAHGLERGLDRFGAAARRQRAIETRQLREPLEEARQKLVVKDARRHGEALRLLDQRAHDARMRVAVAHRRIRAHHVEIAAAVLVPQPAAVAVRDHDRQRIVIARGMPALACDGR